MRKLITASAIGLALAFSAAQASAADFVSDFLGSGTTWASNYDLDAPIHYFYFDGARADESYNGTGLDSVSSAQLDLVYNVNKSEPLTFTFALNGQDIGDWTVNEVSGASMQTLNFAFGPIAANAGQTFSLSMRVTDGVCSGCGNVNFSENSPTTLRLSGGGDTVVPEPATWAFMIMGFGAAGATLRRRRALAA